MQKHLHTPIPYIFVSHDSLPVTIYKDVGMGYVSFIFHNWELTKLQTILTGSGIIYEFLDQAFWFRCPIAGSVWDSFTITSGVGLTCPKAIASNVWYSCSITSSPYSCPMVSSVGPGCRLSHRAGFGCPIAGSIRYHIGFSCPIVWSAWPTVYSRYRPLGTVVP